MQIFSNTCTDLPSFTVSKPQIEICTQPYSLFKKHFAEYKNILLIFAGKTQFKCPRRQKRQRYGGIYVVRVVEGWKMDGEVGRMAARENLYKYWRR
jgi:hypothetical protein